MNMILVLRTCNEMNSFRNVGRRGKGGKLPPSAANVLKIHNLYFLIVWDLRILPLRFRSKLKFRQAI